MAVAVERLVATLEMRLDKYEKSLAKARGETNRQFGAIEKRGKQMESRLQNVGSSLNRVFAGVFASAIALRGAQQLVDASTRITNSLKVAGLEGEALTKVYDQLFASAQRNAAPIETLVQLYSRASLVQKELGVSTEELLGFTDSVAMALRVAGTDAGAASGALLQLSQALGSGTVRAEEFNSILEGALPIAQAAAAGLREAGGSVAALRQLVVDGKVSSEAFFRAFEAGSVILEDKVAGAELTVSQGFVRLQNVLVDAAGKIDETAGISEDAAGALNTLANAVQTVGDFFANNQAPIQGFLGALSAVEDQAYKTAYAIGLTTGKAIFGAKPSGMVAEAFNQTGGSGSGDAAQDAAIAAALSARGGGSAPTVVNVGRTVTPVSLSDYAAPAKRGGGSGGRARGGSRGGGRGGGGASAAQREADAVKKLITELERERDLIGATDEQRKLSDALRRAGAAATGEQKEKIAELITAIEREEAAMESLKATQQEVNDLGRDVLGGMISDLRAGADASDILSNALSRVADKLIDISLNSIFSSGGIGGGIGGIISSLFGGFRASGGSVQSGKAYVVGEKGPELFAPGRSGTIIPNNASGGASQQSVHVTVGVDVDKSGNLTPFVTSISDQRAQVRVQQGAQQLPAQQSDRQRRVG